MSQRRLCTRLKSCAPRTDAKLIPVLCDLLTVSSPELHDLLRRDLDRLTHNQTVKKVFSIGTYEGKVTKRFDY